MEATYLLGVFLALGQDLHLIEERFVQGFFGVRSRRPVHQSGTPEPHQTKGSGWVHLDDNRFAKFWHSEAFKVPDTNVIPLDEDQV
jgi:hypothetical protein